MKRKNSRIFIFSLILLTAAAGAVLYAGLIYKERNRVVISHDSGIYEESLLLSVDIFSPGVIYYTVNGEKPDPEHAGEPGQGTLVYEEPLYLELGQDTALYSLQFCCLFEDGTVSDIYKRDYILDDRGSGRFSTKYILSVTGAEDRLLGYEEGIFVRGRQFDEFMEENPDVDILGTTIPANYLSNEEIPVNAAFFSGDGTEILSQNCGIRIYGNISRAKNQKSFRLYARHDYDEVNEFSYAFLPNLISEERGTVIDAFQRLSFHNSGNDHGYAFLRTELIGELARRSGFQDVLVAESVTVYVNGRYMGVYWLENTYDDRYFKEKYGDYDGEMVVCEGWLGQMKPENIKTEAEEQSALEYNEFCTWAAETDMTDQRSWERVCNTIDVENFARYMAIEYYVNNFDWLDNNVKVYRYLPAEGEAYREGTVFDGRYRYLLFDTDYGMALKFQGWYGVGAEDPRLYELCETSGYTGMFRSLLKRDEFRVLFIQSIVHLMNGAFSPEGVYEVLDEYHRKRDRELEYMMESTELLKNSLWEPDDNNMENVLAELAEIGEFADIRPGFVLEEMQQEWDCGEMTTVSVNRIPGCSLYMGGLQVEETVRKGISEEADEKCYEGKYPENVPLEIRWDTAPGITVKGYYVNSKFVEGESITLEPGKWQKAERVTIDPVFSAEPVESVVIDSYHIRGKEDYVVLRNNGQTTVLLSDYALTDSEEKQSRGRLPDVELKPGEEYVVYGRKYSGSMTENSVRLPISWKAEDTVRLIHASGREVDCKNAGNHILIEPPEVLWYDEIAAWERGFVPQT